MREIIAGCCQFSIKPADIDANFETVERELEELAARKCRLAVLPEMWSCSFPYPVLPKMAERTQEIVERLGKIARQHDMVIVGSLPEAEDETVYNTSYIVDVTGKVAGTYRKAHLFSLYGEHRKFGKGRSAAVFKTGIGKLGAIICYDLRFPELTRKLALEGAEIVCVSAVWPLARIEHWSLLLRARAVENQLFVIGTNGCGTEGKITWGGSSAIISAWGDVISAAGTEDQTITGVLSRGEMRDFREKIPCFKDRNPDVY